jgi:chorismate mutase
MSDISQIRQQIDAIDTELVRLLLERAICVEKIGGIKKDHGIPIRDREREAFQMGKVRQMCQGSDRSSALAVSFVFRALIEASVVLQGETNVSAGPYNCSFCGWRTGGILNADFNWPVCPACQNPLFPAQLQSAAF